MNRQQIIDRLECSGAYADKMLEWTDGDMDKLRRLVAFKTQERQTRKAVVVYEPDSYVAG